MSYIKKEYVRLLNLTDTKFIIPTHFTKFIEKVCRTHNLIIKKKDKQYYCTHCNSSFKNNKKINENCKCPICKVELRVKSSKLKYWIFKDYVQLIDKIEDHFVIRTFEIYSSMKDNHFTNHYTEFMRSFIIGDEVQHFISDTVNNNMGYMYINHFRSRTNWKKRNLRWSYQNIQAIVDYQNLKQIFKNSVYQYMMLHKFLKVINYIDIEKYLVNAKYYQSFELLVKLKLYNLAKAYNKFYLKGTFEERFGVTKDYLPFMQKHNINYEQLKVLRLLKKKDIKLINKLTRFNTLSEINNYIDVESAYKNILSNKKNDEHIYLDYLRFAVELGYNLKSKKIAFPNNLQIEHDRLENMLEVIKDEKNNMLIKERVKCLNEYVYKNKEYIIFPANSVESLIEESRQQENCVKTYTERYASAKCDIYFMRKIEELEKSLVTIEVIDNKVYQCKGKRNMEVSKKEDTFIKRWEERKLGKEYGL